MAGVLRRMHCEKPERFEQGSTPDWVHDWLSHRRRKASTNAPDAQNKPATSIRAALAEAEEEEKPSDPFLAGRGWGNMPEPSVRADLAAGRLVRLQLPEVRGGAYLLHAIYRTDTRGATTAPLQAPIQALPAGGRAVVAGTQTALAPADGQA